MTNEMVRLKVSLADTISSWLTDVASISDGWNDLDIPEGNNTAKIMADCAFNVLLGMQDMKDYQYQNDLLVE